MIKCPVCKKVYSYGRMISHLCDGNTFFFGSIFKETTPKYQWNCFPHPTLTNKSIPSHDNNPTLSDVKETSRCELYSYQKSSKILYPWNCHSNQQELNLVLHLTISDKELVYE